MSFLLMMLPPPPPFTAPTATSSPIVPETKMNGTSIPTSRQILRATTPPKPGMPKSDRMICGRNSSSARRKSASDCTLRLSNFRPERFNSCSTSSASRSESSASRILMASFLLAGRESGVRLWRRLIDDRPEMARLPDGVDELLEAHRLHDIRIDAQLVAFHEIRLLARGGQHDHRNGLEARVALDLAQHLQ